MNIIHFHRDDLEAILEFFNKYRDVEFVTVTADSSSGIGTLLSASVKTPINGDFVTITKDIVDESSW
jgi:hypothetical protein